MLETVMCCGKDTEQHEVVVGLQGRGVAFLNAVVRIQVTVPYWDGTLANFKT